MVSLNLEIWTKDYVSQARAYFVDYKYLFELYI